MKTQTSRIEHSSHETDSLGLSVSEAAKLIGVSRQLVYQAVNSGELVARRCFGRTIILKSDVLAFLNALPFVNTKRST